MEFRPFWLSHLQFTLYLLNTFLQDLDDTLIRVTGLKKIPQNSTTMQKEFVHLMSIFRAFTVVLDGLGPNASPATTGNAITYMWVDQVLGRVVSVFRAAFSLFTSESSVLQTQVNQTMLVFAACLKAAAAKYMDRMLDVLLLGMTPSLRSSKEIVVWLDTLSLVR